MAARFPIGCGLAAAFLLLAAVRPAQAQVFDPKSATLANGLKVVVIENHRVPAVMHMLWYGVGAADEPEGKSGIAHFLEHLMFKGTKKIAPGEFSKIVARNGGRDNAFTSYDYTGYFQKVSKDRLEMVIRMEADRMVNLTLAENHVLSERDVVREERRSRIDNDPNNQLHERMQAVLFNTHPYRRPIIGWDHEIKNLSRKDALDFYRRWYAPNNAALVVVGDVGLGEVLPLAEKYFGPIKPRPIPERVRPQELAPLGARRIEHRDARVRQAQWSRMYLAPSYVGGETKHAYALQVLSEILGEGSSSRLYRALVAEKKLATGVGSGYDPEARDLGGFSIAVTPRAGVAPEEAEKAVDAEIARLLAEGVTEDETARAKTRMRASVVFARDSLYTGARVVGTALTSGLSLEDVEAWPRRIAEVTAADVLAAAKHVLKPEASVTGILLPAKGAAK